MDKIAEIFVVVAIIFIILGMLVVVGSKLDAHFSPTKTGSGRIIQKQYVKAHSTTSRMMVGKVMVPQTIRHPEKWQLTVKVSKSLPDTGTINVSRYVYSQVEINDQVSVKYSTGRLFKHFVIKGVE